MCHCIDWLKLGNVNIRDSAKSASMDKVRRARTFLYCSMSARRLSLWLSGVAARSSELFTCSSDSSVMELSSDSFLATLHSSFSYSPQKAGGRNETKYDTALKLQPACTKNTTETRKKKKKNKLAGLWEFFKRQSKCIVCPDLLASIWNHSKLSRLHATQQIVRMNWCLNRQSVAVYWLCVVAETDTHFAAAFVAPPPSPRYARRRCFCATLLVHKAHKQEPSWYV